MEIRVELPMSVEGDWQLLNSDGNVIATSENNPDAKLVVVPYFYDNSKTQTFARTCVTSSKGYVQRQVLQIGGKTGRITSEKATQPKRVSAPFDKLGPGDRPFNPFKGQKKPVQPVQTTTPEVTT